ncbi:heme oxygenase-like protein [Streptomyces sp. Ag109_G2-6]|uniref:iron-containing redox enzyme family protein n=1 Tax=Streptomyces TaxID=1883 RepID=UPI000CB027CF|nr:MULTISPECIES: iron-containing redox enzyme family protein [Streptomyces]RPF25439.1 heme oxygenase-like protein [Streptomyces sp. Ag109_G2-6]
MSAPLTPDEDTSLDMARSFPAPAYTLPDLTTSLPSGPFEASPQGAAEAARITAGPPAGLFRRLIADQESEAVLLSARRVLAAFLTPADEEDEYRTDGPGPDADADAVAAHVLAVRAELAAVLGPLRTHPDPEVRTAVLRQRAPLALTGGCWLDTLSQAATQPAEIVGRLFGQHWLLQGEGTSEAGLLGRRRRALIGHGIHLPGVESAAFLDAAGARPLTALHGAFHLALSRLPASFLPEVVGVHYAAHALGLDELLLGTEPMLAESDVRPVLAAYLAFTEDSPTGPADRRRALAAVRLLLRLEREHTAALAELAAWHDGLSLDAKVARIVERHAPHAGRQHGAVRLGTRRLTDWLDTGDLDAAAFVRELRGSRQLKPARDGGPCRFLKAVKFGGPMFGIFDETEAAVLTAWARAVADGEPAGAGLTPLTAGDATARVWSGRLAAADPADILVGEPEGPEDHRRFFHRLVNFEHHPSVLPLARARAEAGLAEAEILFEHGAEGLLTDASWFPYTPEALLERVERIYWDKLVDPYEPLTEIPSRDEVVFEQSTYALGSLIDGTWAHRVGNLGRRGRRSDDMLFAIYADEMGRGDTAKNHITLIHKVLASMDMDLPHIRQEAFLHQGELPDHLYGFSVHQLCLSLFPDSLYNEILGYNLGIEMFGLGALRMHEIQKLRRYGLDASYEEAHLSIDNFSAGHARQSADIVVAYLDEVRHLSGEEAVQREWRRIWRGYASFAFFIEHALVKRVRAAASEDAGAPAELVI